MSRRVHDQLNAALMEPDALPPAPIERTRRLPASLRAQGLERMDLAGKLEALSGDALERAGDLLSMDITDEEHEKFGEKVRGLNSVIKTVLQTQVRVDEHRLKARNADALPELIELIRQEEAKMKAIAEA